MTGILKKKMAGKTILNNFPRSCQLLQTLVFLVQDFFFLFLHKAYFITSDDMKVAMTRYPDLVDRLWKVCGVRIAVPLLLEVPAYYNWTKDKIRVMCERSFIVNLPIGLNTIFKTNEQMKEVN